MLKQAIALALAYFISFSTVAAVSSNGHEKRAISGKKSVHKSVKKKRLKKRAKLSRSRQSRPQSSLACLARNIYFEAAGESKEGKIAVANVTMNRVKSDYYPETVCGVVYQSNRRACAFSWTCDRRSNVPPENDMYKESEEIAKQALAGELDDVAGEADHYHADYVRPKWRKKLVRVTQIGRHIFYKRPNS